jgi:hypothetical protein
MTSLTNRLGKSISRKMKGYFLSSGNCHTCRPKRCAIKDGNNCRNPIERAFSLESTGVLVTDLMRCIFNIDLQWWKRDDPSYIPKFMAKVIGIKKNDNFIFSDTRLAILEALNNERVDVLSCT